MVPEYFCRHKKVVGESERSGATDDQVTPSSQENTPEFQNDYLSIRGSQSRYENTDLHEDDYYLSVLP